MTDRTAYFDRVQAAAGAVRSRLDGAPEVAVVLGSGLGAFADAVGRPVEIPYGALPGWPVPRVVGHDGRLVAGDVQGRRVLVLAGRCHVYEGHDSSEVTFGVRVAGLLGARTLIATNAAGGIDPALAPGALVVIDDHLNLMGNNPLIGPDAERFGPRFPDMTDAYSTRLRQIADSVGAALGAALPHGVYAAVTGPSYETPAEIRYLRTIGAHLVGMSTVPEVIAARQMGLEVLGISCVTNPAAGVGPHRLDHGDVLDAARRVGARFVALLEGIIGRL
jgi:purine-nucleoside phosphorylase